jgi:beta-lactamase class A
VIIKIKKIILIVITVFILIGLLGYFSYKILVIYEKSNKERIVLEKRKIAWINLKGVLASRINRFPGVCAVVVEDLSTGWSYAHNDDKLFASASLVKLPIMLAVFQAELKGMLDLDGTIKLKRSHITGGSGVLKGMPLGSFVSGDKLIEYMINNSDNTASNIFIDSLGFNYLNNTFKNFGLKNTNLSRKMMDFTYRKRGVENYTTAGDMSLLLRKLYKQEILSPSLSKKALNLLSNQKINDRIPVKLPYGTLVAHKTGLERYVCHDIGIVYTKKGDYLITVLTKSKKGFNKSKILIANLALDVYNYYNNF